MKCPSGDFANAGNTSAMILNECWQNEGPLGMQANSLRAFQITLAQSGKNTICCSNTTDASECHCYCKLLNIFKSCISLYYYLYIYLSIHSSSGLTADTSWIQLQVCQQMMNQWSLPCNCAQYNWCIREMCLKDIIISTKQRTLKVDISMNSEIHVNILINGVWRCTEKL
jgi:hypothetical protein